MIELMFYIDGEVSWTLGEAAAVRWSGMAMMRREVPSGLVRMGPKRRTGRLAPAVTTAGLVAVAVFVAFQLASTVALWVQIKVGDLQYGYPRSVQLEGYLGFHETTGRPSHFVAINLHRQVLVVYMPGDDPFHPTVLRGPYLTGANSQYDPVTLRLVDVNGDGYPDVVASVDGRQVAWIGDPRAGRPRAPLPGEHLALDQPSTQAP